MFLLLFILGIIAIVGAKLWHSSKHKQWMHDNPIHALPGGGQLQYPMLKAHGESQDGNLPSDGQSQDLQPDSPGQPQDSNQSSDDQPQPSTPNVSGQPQGGNQADLPGDIAAMPPEVRALFVALQQAAELAKQGHDVEIIGSPEHYPYVVQPASDRAKVSPTPGSQATAQAHTSSAGSRPITDVNQLVRDALQANTSGSAGSTSGREEPPEAEIDPTHRAQYDSLIQQLQELMNRPGAGMVSAWERLGNIMAGLENMVARYPEVGQLHYYLGLTYSLTGQMDEAARRFEMAIALCPTWPEPIYQRGISHAHMGDSRAALVCFERASELAPDVFEYAYATASMYREVNDDKHALHWFRVALSLNPSHLDCKRGLIMLLLQAGQEDAAYELLQELAAADETDANAHRLLAQLYQNRNDHQRALSHVLRVMDLTPDDWQAHAKAIQLCQALGMLQERDHYRKRLFELRNRGHIPSLVQTGMYCREQVMVGKHQVMVMEDFDSVDIRRYKYRFLVVENNQPVFRVTLGSASFTNDMLRASGRLGPNERAYQLESESPTSHATYAFFRELPSYDEVRELAFQVIRGVLRPITQSIYK